MEDFLGQYYDLLLGAQISPSLIFLFLRKKFVFLVLAPVGGINQTFFLTLQGMGLLPCGPYLYLFSSCGANKNFIN